MTRLAILGSTGSVGVSTLDVAGAHRERFRIAALAAGGNLDRLRGQIAAHSPELVAVASDADARLLRTEFPTVEIVSGDGGLELAARHEGIDMVVVAVAGSIGLRPTLAAIDAGRDVALATKEVLVMAGELVMAEVQRAGVRLLPIDSEHGALRQILLGRSNDAVERLVLTASGGPFRTWTTADMDRATVDDALAHPTWSMGPKISVDSATMMNKGLEVIEAHHLFAVPEDKTDVVVHPQSIVHALVEFTDGSILAQLSIADMRLPILAALAAPDRLVPNAGRLDLTTSGPLEFFEPDPARFPALNLARSALRSGGEAPTVLNAANEIAVAAFLDGRCSFGRITATIDAVMSAWRQPHRPVTSIEQALAVDAEARRLTTAELGNTKSSRRVPSS